ncbi:Uncharacterized protein FWK35_00024004 [Aphis craccivora]|uniref:Uncharacterized protein n=1 Tax=Aphis craccivora TaxID=307492 RepID=A0A6G0YQ55_APHCR|nr:Uncharacterized protein FWK35_00024004 [Aphis craccivora]
MDIYIKKKKKEKNLYRLYTETRKYCIKAKTELWTGTAEGLLYLDKGIAGGRVCGSITAKRVFGLLQTVTILNFAVARNSGFSVETICVHIYIYAANKRRNASSRAAIAHHGSGAPKFYAYIFNIREIILQARNNISSHVYKIHIILFYYYIHNSYIMTTF